MTQGWLLKPETILWCMGKGPWVLWILKGMFPTGVCQPTLPPIVLNQRLLNKVGIWGVSGETDAISTGEMKVNWLSKKTFSKETIITVTKQTTWWLGHPFWNIFAKCGFIATFHQCWEIKTQENKTTSDWKTMTVAWSGSTTGKCSTKWHAWRRRSWSFMVPHFFRWHYDIPNESATLIWPSMKAKPWKPKFRSL